MSSSYYYSNFLTLLQGCIRIFYCPMSHCASLCWQTALLETTDKKSLDICALRGILELSIAYPYKGNEKKEYASDTVQRTPDAEKGSGWSFAEHGLGAVRPSAGVPVSGRAGIRPSQRLSIGEFRLSRTCQGVFREGDVNRGGNTKRRLSGKASLSSLKFDLGMQRDFFIPKSFFLRPIPSLILKGCF